MAGNGLWWSLSWSGWVPGMKDKDKLNITPGSKLVVTPGSARKLVLVYMWHGQTSGYRHAIQVHFLTWGLMICCLTTDFFSGSFNDLGTAHTLQAGNDILQPHKLLGPPRSAGLLVLAHHSICMWKLGFPEWPGVRHVKEIHNKVVGLYKAEVEESI